MGIAATLPFFWNYARAFTINCVGGTSGLVSEYITDNQRSDNSNAIDENVTSLFLTGGKTLEVAAGLMMSQAALLSLGYQTLGLMNLNIVIITPIVLQLLAVTANYFEAPETIRNALNKMNEHIGHIAMLAALVSSVVIILNIGFFDLLPVALAINLGYWTYTVINSCVEH